MKVTGSQFLSTGPEWNVQGRRTRAKGGNICLGKCTGKLSSEIQGTEPDRIHSPNREILETTASCSSESPSTLTTRPTCTGAYSSSSSDDDVRDERSDFSLDLSSSSSSSSSEYTSLVFNGCFLARSSSKKKSGKCLPRLSQ